jgi:hypothetical protein
LMAQEVLAVVAVKVVWIWMTYSVSLVISWRWWFWGGGGVEVFVALKEVTPNQSKVNFRGSCQWCWEKSKSKTQSSSQEYHTKRVLLVMVKGKWCVTIPFW